jgi:hypothetical protein
MAQARWDGLARSIGGRRRKSCLRIKREDVGLRVSRFDPSIKSCFAPVFHAIFTCSAMSAPAGWQKSKNPFLSILTISARRRARRRKPVQHLTRFGVTRHRTVNLPFEEHTPLPTKNPFRSSLSAPPTIAAKSSCHPTKPCTWIRRRDRPSCPPARWSRSIDASVVRSSGPG